MEQTKKYAIFAALLAVVVVVVIYKEDVGKKIDRYIK